MANMQYTILFPTGRILQTYLRQTAECYAAAYGGTIISDISLNTTPSVLASKNPRIFDLATLPLVSAEL